MKLVTRILTLTLAAVLLLSVMGLSIASAETYPLVTEPVTVKGLVVGRSTATRTDRIVWNKVSEITGVNIE